MRKYITEEEVKDKCALVCACVRNVNTRGGQTQQPRVVTIALLSGLKKSLFVCLYLSSYTHKLGVNQLNDSLHDIKRIAQASGLFVTF